MQQLRNKLNYDFSAHVDHEIKTADGAKNTFLINNVI